MPRIEMDTETSLPPEQVVAALTDFTERRVEIWPGISPKYYEVYSVGDTSAEVREGTVAGPMKIWARERYDWSTPGTVQWTVMESNFCKPGSYVRADVGARQGGGSRIHCTWERTATNLGYALMFQMIKLSGGKPISKSMNQGLENYEQMRA
jgi:hypothetical protein